MSSMNLKRNMLIYFLGKLIPAVSVLFIMIAGVRFLGKSEFGRYTLLFNCINIALTFCVGWIQQSMLRFSSGNVPGNEGLFRQFLIYTLYAALVATAGIFLLDLFYFGEHWLNALLVAAFTFIFSLFTVQLTSLQCRFQSTRFAILETLFYLITIISIAGVIYYAFPPKMIFFFGGWLLAAVSWLVMESIRNGSFVLGSIKSDLDKNFLKRSFHYGVLITSWLMISGLFNVVDRFIIRYFYDYEQVGVYSVVYDFIYRLTSFATLPVLLTLHPQIMESWNGGRRKEAMSSIRKALMLLGAMLCAELLFYFVAGNWFFHKYFNLDTKGLTLLMIPLSISSVLWQSALFIHKPLELLFRQRHMIIAILGSLLANLALNFIFVPRFGILAAALVTLASTILYIAYVIVAEVKFKSELAG